MTCKAIDGTDTPRYAMCEDHCTKKMCTSGLENAIILLH